jgi:hypothetical protein
LIDEHLCAASAVKKTNPNQPESDGKAATRYNIDVSLPQHATVWRRVCSHFLWRLD